MNWQNQLIWIYLFICKHFSNLEGYCMRHTNHANLSFTDEEVLAIYLFGVIDGRRSIKAIYEYAEGISNRK